MENVTANKIDGLNRLLAEVYKNNKTISCILAAEDFSADDLLILNPEQLLQKSLELLDSRFKRFPDMLPDPQLMLLIVKKSFGILDGQIYSIESIADDINKTVERTKEIKDKCISLLKNYLRISIIDAACLIAGKEKRIIAESYDLKTHGKTYLSRVLIKSGLSKAFPWVTPFLLKVELRKSGYLEVEPYNGKTEFFPTEKGRAIGIKTSIPDKSRLYLEKEAQDFIIEFVKEKFGAK